jgi:hypothetical protein
VAIPGCALAKLDATIGRSTFGRLGPIAVEGVAAVVVVATVA